MVSRRAWRGKAKVTEKMKYGGLFKGLDAGAKERVSRDREGGRKDGE